MMVPIQKKITLVNRTLGNNRLIKYIVIHYVGAVSSAKANVDYFYSANRGASAHYFVDENSIWQCVEDKDSAWHCGAKKYYNECRNSNSIGIEMCCKKDTSGNLYIGERTVQNTIELVKELMKKYNINVMHVVRHYDVTHKICPEPFVRDESKWKNFLMNLKDKEWEEEKMIKELCDKYGEEAVKKALVKLIETVNDDGVEAKWATEELEEAKNSGITDGTNPEMFCTRQEAAIMVKRALAQK